MTEEDEGIIITAKVKLPPGVTMDAALSGARPQLAISGTAETHKEGGIDVVDKFEPLALSLVGQPVFDGKGHGIENIIGKVIEAHVETVVPNSEYPIWLLDKVAVPHSNGSFGPAYGWEIIDLEKRLRELAPKVECSFFVADIADEAARNGTCECDACKTKKELLAMADACAKAKTADTVENSYDQLVEEGNKLVDDAIKKVKEDFATLEKKKLGATLEKPT